MPPTDTIAAISTPLVESAIGIVRISGPDARKTGLSLFSPKNGKTDIKPGRLYYGAFKDAPGGRAIDDGFFVFMEAPRSYTGEDVVELQCHGSALILKKLLEGAIKSGARLSLPGEFTKRAFLNERLDLAEAEAVIDVIRAKTERALLSARSTLEGRLSRKVNKIKERLVLRLCLVEALLDFPEDDLGAPDADFLKDMEEAKSASAALLSTYEEGALLKDGIKTLILGSPNVGKSSLLNCLLQQDRAIVTDLPGTTRDVIEDVLDIRGIPVRLMDTAGLHETADYIESIGIRAAKDRLGTAGLVILVIDASKSGHSEDRGLIGLANGKKLIVAANKADICGQEDKDAVVKEFGGHEIVFISALKETGIEGLKDAIYEKAAGRECLEDYEAGVMSSARHKALLEAAVASVERVISAIREDTPYEFIATDLRDAINSLGEITGEVTTDDVLDKIFSNFCIGK